MSDCDTHLNVDKPQIPCPSLITSFTGIRQISAETASCGHHGEKHAPDRGSRAHQGRPLLTATQLLTLKGRGRGLLDWRCLEVNANFLEVKEEEAFAVVFWALVDRAGIALSSLSVSALTHFRMQTVYELAVLATVTQKAAVRDPFESKVEPTATHPHVRTSGGPLGLLLTGPFVPVDPIKRRFVGNRAHFQT